ncbi:erythromycin esterase family protein [Nocardia sp. CC227C]|uniref:erythromycin esterase family protein n=1 Tax=Nocardia sp. CC227C TaxID=3044562 RepID=UPI00278BCBA2|nr:erythromycin esterase family protein [Nocardia sp. CC227C]
MSQDIRAFVPPSCDLVGLGEPTHFEPAFARLRNDLFARLVDSGFRSFALESDRVAGFVVDDFVQEGVGDLDTALREGISHDFGELEANRDLVAWLREYNEGRPPEQRVACHGIDAPLETMSAPGPRRYLEFARDYLELDLDLTDLLGADERWSRTEAVLDPAMSPGATAEAEKLATIGDDLLSQLYGRAPALIAKTSRAQWLRARANLTAALGLLRYHRQAARRLEPEARISLLSGTRDVLMAQNLLEIRDIEADRGPTLVFAHNSHLQRTVTHMPMGELDITWSPTGAIAAQFLGDRYTFIAGSLGHSEAIDLGEPAPDTFEGFLQHRFPTWGLLPVADLPTARVRTDVTQPQGYFPLDPTILAGMDAVLHIA